MAGDLPITERAVLEGSNELRAVGAPAPGSGAADAARVIHRYGRLAIVAGPEGRVEALPEAGLVDEDGLDDVERLGLTALRLRESADYRTAKEYRPRAGEAWDMPDCTEVVPTPRASVAF